MTDDYGVGILVIGLIFCVCALFSHCSGISETKKAANHYKQVRQGTVVHDLGAWRPSVQGKAPGPPPVIKYPNPGNAPEPN